MLLKFLSIVLLSTLVVAELPSYFKVCGRRDPNLKKCVLAATEALRDKLRTGIPELGIPPIEPLHHEGFPLTQTDALKSYLRNIKVSGFSNFEVKSYDIDFEKKTFYVTAVFKKLVLDADYDINAKIIVPIATHGPAHVVADDVEANVTFKYKLIKKNGADYTFISSMTTKLSIDDYSLDFKPVDGPDSPVVAAIHAAIEGGRKEILETFKPNIEKVISREVLKIANQICSHFTFDELFPDRE